MKRIFLLIPILLVLHCSYPESDDQTYPQTVVIYPYEGAVISSNIEVNIQASDNDKISKVWFYVDGIEIDEKTKSPYSFNYDISGLTKRVNHVIQSAAKDDAGNTSYSPLVTFTVAETEDIVDPVVSIVNPQSGQVVEGIVNITAEAEDDRSVQKVAFYIDGDSAGFAASYPYIYNWNTSSLSDSTAHTIYAKAFDSGNNTSISPVITVTVYPRTGEAGDNIPPTALFLYPITGTTVGGTVEVSVDLYDNTAVSKAEFYVDGQPETEENNPSVPWIFNWNTTALIDSSTHTLYVKAYDAAGNLGTSSLLIITTIQ